MKTTLTALAGLAVAGAALACDCPAPESTSTTELTATAAPLATVAGDTKRHSRELRIEVNDDGEARYFVNGKEVDEDAFREAGGTSASFSVALPDGTTKLIGQGADHAFPAAAGPRPVRLGVVLGDISEALAAQLDVDADEAILIEQVLDGTPAANAGLEPYDVIVEFDDEDGIDIDRLRALLAKKHPGDTAELEVLRGGDDVDIVVTFDGNAFFTGPEAPAPPTPGAAPFPEKAPRARVAPRSEHFFARGADREQKERLKQALRLAEEHAERAQAEAKRWAYAVSPHGDHDEHADHDDNEMTFSIQIDGDDMEEYGQAMEKLHQFMEDQDFDFDFDFEDLPRIRFVGPKGGPNNGPTALQNLKDNNRYVVLERQLQDQARGLRDRGLAMKERAAELEHRIREQADRSAEMAERHIERLEARIDKLERMLEKALAERHEREPRGSRN